MPDGFRPFSAQAGERLEALDRFMAGEVVRGERIVAWTRLLLAVGGFIHVLVVGRFPGMAAATGDSKLTTAGLTLAGIYSAWTLATLRRAKKPEFRLLGSVTADAVLIFMVTSGDLFWPDPDYLGVLREPSVALFLLAAIGAGARLSRSVAVFGSLLMAGVAATMVLVEQATRPEVAAYGLGEITVGVILFAAAGLLSYTSATRTLNLVYKGARSALAAERTRQRFGVYVSEEVAEQVLRDGTLERGGRRQPVVVLFCDLRGFTAYAEKTPAERLVTELNAYLDDMLGVVRAEGGFLDKYIGDALMVIYGFPEPKPDDALRALRTAAGMRRALAAHNERRRAAGKPTFDHGIGIHYGPAIVGNIGTEDRLQFTAVGGVVNLASRLEAATKSVGRPVLVSSEAAEQARNAPGADVPPLEPVGEVQLPGREAPLEVFTLREDDPQAPEAEPNAPQAAASA